jgi:hypothetical protein
MQSKSSYQKITEVQKLKISIQIIQDPPPPPLDLILSVQDLHILVY